MSGRKKGPGWDSPGAPVTTKKRADELEAKLAEMRALAGRGVITREALALWEAQSATELIELREANRRTGAPMGEAYKWKSTPEERQKLARGESLTESRTPAPAVSTADVAVELYEAFLRGGHSEREALVMAAGRDMSEAEVRRAVAARGVGLSESARSGGDGALDADLEESFRAIGLSESAARIAARGR